MLFVSDNWARPPWPLPVFGEILDDISGWDICSVLGQQQKDLLWVGLLLQQEPKKRVRSHLLCRFSSHSASVINENVVSPNISCSVTRSPISESRRVLQESCEFFLKHNSRVQHKKKHYNPRSHKLKVISKSMGTSTGAAPTSASATNKGTSALSNHEPHVPGSLSEASAREHLERGTSSRSSKREERDREREREGGERRSKGGSSSKVSSRSESMHRVHDGRWDRFEIP